MEYLSRQICLPKSSIRFGSSSSALVALLQASYSARVVIDSWGITLTLPCNVKPWQLATVRAWASLRAFIAAALVNVGAVSHQQAFGTNRLHCHKHALLDCPAGPNEQLAGINPHVLRAVLSPFCRRRLVEHCVGRLPDYILQSVHGHALPMRHNQRKIW